MFERFTGRARKVVVLAQDEARHLRHGYIGTEHLLLGLIREGEGVAALALRECGVGLDGAREQVEAIVGRGEEEAGSQAPFTPRSKKVLELALRESLQLGHSYMGTEHLLLGLLDEREGIAVAVLSNLGVDSGDLRQEVLSRLGGGARFRAERGLGPLGWTREALRRSFGRYPSREERLSFDDFTERARRVVVLAQDEARHFNHNYIGTEHLLLGLLREEDGAAGRVLGNLGLHLDEVREQVEAIVGYGESTGAQAPFTPRTQKVLQMAAMEARQLDHDHVTREHILLGLVREGEGVAARVLLSLDVDPGAVRGEVLREIAGGESRYDPANDIEGEVGVEEEETYGALFRGRVGGIGAEMMDEDGRGRVPVAVDLEYEYHVTRNGSQGFEAINYTYVRDLVERFLEACEPSILEEVAGLTCDMLVGEIPRLHKVTVTATREDPGSDISVSATFQS